ncbi:MAG: 1-deoxy-D-xylulose-5-phosphate synthase [Clostridia bacterium]|nr:1-deoxy-D-xylulose-5-phosphate synthase [Clostridia bacterium]
MAQILDRIKKIKELKALNYREKKILADEIRNKLLESVSKTGGHLASNLGVVELTIALHSVFDTPKDKIIWDVGHQTYVHKILTGRKDYMDTLRQLNGIAGFPKTSESEYDSFNTGHSSTSISVALGMSKARDLKGEDNNIIAVIGDGALTGGMAFEALNDTGASDTKMIVILNDNEMSISKNVGGISAILTKLRTRKIYTKSNRWIKQITLKIPFLGKFIIAIVRKIKDMIKQLIIPNMIFEDLGFKYLGPVDGHDIEGLEQILNKAKEMTGPVLIHAITKKGKGYLPAEQNPDKFHSTSKFDVRTGESLTKKCRDYSSVFGEKLVELAKKDKKVVAITAAMCDGTGLTKFKKKFPDRFFDVAIAEQHAMGLAAGLAKEGLKPVVSIYSSFYQRAYDQIIHDICIQKLPVVMCIDRAGIVGNDGETHQGIFDLSFLSIIPNITIMAPKDFHELEEMMELAINLNEPVVIRYPKGTQENIDCVQSSRLQKGKMEILKEGTDLSIIAIGKMVSKAVNVAKELEKEGIYAEVINARFLKPLDKDILKSIDKTGHAITIEDNVVKGGFGENVLELMNESNIDGKIKILGYPDKFIKHGSIDEIERIYGLDEQSIKRVCANLFCKN